MAQATHLFCMNVESCMWQVKMAFLNTSERDETKSSPLEYVAPLLGA